MSTVRMLQPVIPLTPEMVADFEVLQVLQARALASIGQEIKWKLLGSRDPWPRSGFDFRTNNDRNRVPRERESDCCDECGRPYDE